MSRIDDAFAKNKDSGRKGFIPYLTAGFPTLEESADLVLAAADAGSTLIELGVPFSDPIADGPVIQHSSQIALENGVTLERIIDMVSKLRQRTDCPLVLMGYANSFMRYGYERLAADAADAGVHGLIVPDLPPEETGVLATGIAASGLDLIFLVAQTTTEQRMHSICAASSGFIYYIARLGVTGATAEVSPVLADRISHIRAHTDLPVAAGFGISTPEQVAAVVAHADAAIMGSALIRKISDHQGPESAASMVEALVSECNKACATNNGIA